MVASTGVPPASRTTPAICSSVSATLRLTLLAL
jgi:hypothetical protein